MNFDKLYTSLLIETINNRSVVALLEAFYPINEAVQVASALDSAMKNLGLTKKYKIDNPMELSKSSFSTVLGGVTIKSNNRGGDVRLGKFLKKLLPEINDYDITKLIEEITAQLAIENGEYGPYDQLKIEFKIDPRGVYEFYKNCPVGLTSCMAAYNFNDEIGQFYKSQAENLEVLCLYINGEILGRALLWSNINNAIDGMYLDRSYPANDTKIKFLYNKYAVENNWTYRFANDIGSTKGVTNTVDNTNEVSYQCVDLSEIILVPYMDTFRYGNPDGLFKNYNESGDMYTFDDTDGTSINGFVSNFQDEDEDEEEDDDYMIDLSNPENVERVIHSRNSLDQIISLQNQHYDIRNMNPSKFITTRDAAYNIDSLLTLGGRRGNFGINDAGITPESLNIYLTNSIKSGSGFDLSERVYAAMIIYLTSEYGPFNDNDIEKFIFAYITNVISNNPTRLCYMFDIINYDRNQDVPIDSENLKVLNQQILYLIVKSKEFTTTLGTKTNWNKVYYIIQKLNESDVKIPTSIQTILIDQITKVYINKTYITWEIPLKFLLITVGTIVENSKFLPKEVSMIKLALQNEPALWEEFKRTFKDKISNVDILHEI